MAAPITVQNQTGESYIRPEDRPVFDKAMDVALRHAESVLVQGVTVYANGRGVYASAPEWLEYAVVIRYVSQDRPSLVIGLIQRQPGADVECHS